MLNYTKAVIHDTIKDLKRFFFILSLIMQVAYIVYLTYALISKIGNIYVNISLLVLTFAYLVFFIIMYGKKSKAKRYVRRAYKWSKLTINAFTLGVAVYGIYLTFNNANPLTIVLTAVMVILWILQVLLEIVIYYFENRKDLLISSLELDFEFITKPANTVSNIVRKISGKETIERSTVPEKIKRSLDKMAENHKSDKESK